MNDSKGRGFVLRNGDWYWFDANGSTKDKRLAYVFATMDDASEASKKREGWYDKGSIEDAPGTPANPLDEANDRDQATAAQVRLRCTVRGVVRDAMRSCTSTLPAMSASVASAALLQVAGELGPVAPKPVVVDLGNMDGLNADEIGQKIRTSLEKLLGRAPRETITQTVTIGEKVTTEKSARNPQPNAHLVKCGQALFGARLDAPVVVDCHGAAWQDAQKYCEEVVRTRFLAGSNHRVLLTWPHHVPGLLQQRESLQADLDDAQKRLSKAEGELMRLRPSGTPDSGGSLLAIEKLAKVRAALRCADGEDVVERAEGLAELTREVQRDASARQTLAELQQLVLFDLTGETGDVTPKFAAWFRNVQERTVTLTSERDEARRDGSRRLVLLDDIAAALDGSVESYDCEKLPTRVRALVKAHAAQEQTLKALEDVAQHRGVEKLLPVFALGTYRECVRLSGGTFRLRLDRRDPRAAMSPTQAVEIGRRPIRLAWTAQVDGKEFAGTSDCDETHRLDTAAVLVSHALEALCRDVKPEESAPVLSVPTEIRKVIEAGPKPAPVAPYAVRVRRQKKAWGWLRGPGELPVRFDTVDGANKRIARGIKEAPGVDHQIVRLKDGRTDTPTSAESVGPIRTWYGKRAKRK